MLQIEHGRLLKDKLSKPRSGPWPDSRGFGGGGEYGCHFAFLLFGGHQTSAAESIHVLRHPCKIAKEKQLCTARVFRGDMALSRRIHLESAQSITYH